MTERDAFLSNICEHPQDDFPRLQFADWLEEQGDPLGRFIRVQIRLHHEGKVAYGNDGPAVVRLYDRSDPLTGELWQECYELINEHREDWTAPLLIGKKSVFCPPKVLGWSRGFPAYIEGTAAWWVAHADEVLKKCPLERVLFKGRLHYEEKRLTAEEWMTTKVRNFRFHGRRWIEFPRGVSPPGLLPRQEVKQVLLEHYWPGIEFRGVR